MLKERKLNYAKDEHFQLVLDRYGGEDNLKQDFPHILQMLYNTREWHKSIESKIASETETGYSDTFSIVELPTRETSSAEDKATTAVYCDSLMSMVKKHPFLHMSSETTDPKEGKVFGAFSIFDEEVYKLEKSLRVDASYLKYCKEPRVQTCTSFTAYAKVNGKSVCTADYPEKTLEIDISEMKSEVTNIKVNAPVPKKETDTLIRVVYNGRTDSEAVYNFSKAKDRTESGVRYVQVYYPFSIEVTLDEAFEFDPTNPVSFNYNLLISIASSVIDGGEVHFNSAKWSKIKTTVNGNKLTFDFPYSSGTEDNYWYVEMPLTAKQSEGYFDFHLNFSINFGLKGSGNYDLKTSVIISSEDLPESPNLKKIKQSRILWGCLGKDTVIRTENGYKNISEIEVGEKIFSDKGFLALTNIVTGTEEKIVAVGVSEDKTLLITKNHPISTNRGMVRAIDLTISDKIMVEDGTFQYIYYLEVKDYNDKVYSLELEEAALISADGLMVGDYLTPVPDAPLDEEIMEPLEPELIEELKKWSNLRNEQLQKEINV